MDYLQKTPFIILLLALSVVGTFYTSKKGLDLGFAFLSDIEKTVPTLFLFSMLLLIQSGLSSKTLVNVPGVVDRAFTNPLVRLITLFLVAFGSTRNIEESVFIVIGFVSVMQLLRTKEERKRTPYMI